MTQVWPMICREIRTGTEKKNFTGDLSECDVNLVQGQPF